MDWWTVVNRCRALENVACVVAANQGAQLRRYPPYSWPGGSMIVDFDGRILAQASPGPGERIVVAPVDITALRHERQVRRGHHMLAHLRTEAYPVYRRRIYPPEGDRLTASELSYAANSVRIDAAKRQLEATITQQPGDPPALHVAPPRPEPHTRRRLPWRRMLAWGLCVVALGGGGFLGYMELVKKGFLRYNKWDRRERGTLGVGDLAPDLTLASYEGGTVTLSELWRERPVLLVFGSCT
jgi:hypothetical protein